METCTLQNFCKTFGVFQTRDTNLTNGTKKDFCKQTAIKKKWPENVLSLEEICCGIERRHP